MMEEYNKYVEDNDGRDVSFPGFYLGKNAKVKASHRKRDKKKSRK